MLNGSFAEHVCLTGYIPLIIHSLKGTQQTITAVLVKYTFVGLRIQTAEFLLKIIIYSIQFCLLIMDLCIRNVFKLQVDKLLCTVPDSDHASQTFFLRITYINRTHDGIFTVINASIHHRIAEILNLRICRYNFCRQVIFKVILINLRLLINARDPLRCFFKLFCKRSAVVCLTGTFHAKRAGYHFHLSDDHLRMFRKIAVHPDAVFF